VSHVNSSCAKCDRTVGVQLDGRFVAYTLHPYLQGGSRAVAVFCAECFDELGDADGRDRAATTVRLPAPRAVAAR
jgi:hypothetical protein